MRYIRLVIFTATFFCLSNFIFAGTLGSPATTKKNVLMISSFSDETFWGRSIINGFKSAFENDSGYYLIWEETETWEHLGEGYNEKDLNKILRHFQHSKFDIIVAIDPPAINMLLANIDRFPKDAHILISGILGEAPEELKNNPRITTMSFPLAVEGNINIGMKLFPDTKRILFVIDGSEDGLIAQEYMKNIVQNMKTHNFEALPKYNAGVARANLDAVDVVFLNGMDYSTDELMAKIKEYAAKKDEPLFEIHYGWGSEKDGGVYKEQEEYSEMISKIVDKRMIAFFDDSADFVLGGYMTNGVHLGAFIAEKSKILIDNPNSKIDPYEALNAIALRVNWQIFTEKNMRIDTMPSFTAYYDVPPKLWDLIDYRVVTSILLFIVVLALTCLILALRAMRVSQRNALLFQNMPSSIYVFSQSGDIYYSYSADSRLIKFKSIREFGAEFSVAYENSVEQIKAGEKVSIEYSYNAQRLKAVVAKVSERVFGANTFIASVVDISELVETNKKLLKAMEAAQESERAKSYFLATMSHELRTPLNAVIGYSELTQDHSLSAQEREHNLKNINFAANTLLKLINDILDLSKLEAGQMGIFKTAIDVSAVADEFKNIFKFAASKKGITLNVVLENKIPVLMFDILRLRQILMNVVGNAIKFTNSGGIDVKISFENKTKKTGNLLIEVKDTGIGIDGKNLQKVFNAFEQDNLQRVRGQGASEGTGLGLAIVKRLLEKMDGTVAVESAIGKGTTFKFRFENVEISDTPASTSEHHATVEVEHIAVNIEDYKFSLNILIVDDVQMNIKVLGRMLKNMGIEVVEALTPEGALDVLKTYKPDMIMTDLWMPNMSGEELAKKIREDERLKDVPIVAVTADTQILDEGHIFADVLFKPITMRSIFAVLDHHLPKSKNRK